MIGDDTDGYRVLNGENDGFPGLVLDRYADTFVAQAVLARPGSLIFDRWSQ